MHSPSSGPLSYGQLSLWRDVEGLPRSRWHEVNGWTRWHLPDGVKLDQVHDALDALAARHPSLRTRYDLSDPASVRQTVVERGHVTVVEGGADGDPRAEIDALVHQPFDLREDYGWRVRVFTADGEPTDVIMIKHHMVADGWCSGVLERDFRAGLRDPVEAATEVAGPLDLAAWQHDPQRERTRAAAVAYWAKVFDSPAAGGFPGADPTNAGALRCALRSRDAYAGAQDLAARTDTSLSSAVLGAFTLAIARVAATDTLVAQTMCANRFNPRWRDMVTTMNQWTAITLTAVDDLTEHVRAAHRAVMTAYRHGMYDVDTVAALRAEAARRTGTPREATCAYNFVTVPQVTDLPYDDRIVWDKPFSTVGHGCYLQATEEAGTLLTLRMRTMGIDRERVAAIMTETHRLLAA